jgi:hypothetical protein
VSVERVDVCAVCGEQIRDVRDRVVVGWQPDMPCLYAHKGLCVARSGEIEIPGATIVSRRRATKGF